MSNPNSKPPTLTFSVSVTASGRSSTQRFALSASLEVTRDGPRVIVDLPTAAAQPAPRVVTDPVEREALVSSLIGRLMAGSATT